MSRFSLKKTYQLATNPPPAMGWEIYKAHVDEAWNALLASDPPERSVQEFLETHPCLVPGAYTLIGGKSGHWPIHMALISQPVLPSFNHRVPDFMWISTHSTTIFPVLIEIEAPGKPWFRDDGVERGELKQALKQLKDWRIWLRDPVQQLAFRNYYQLPVDRLCPKAFVPRFALIYGRREQARKRPEWTKLRADLDGEDQVVMSYDRLTPGYDYRDFPCVRFRQGKKTVVSVPPTLQLGPSLASRYVHMEGLEAAIQANDLMTDARKEFLLGRLPYWRGWVEAGDRGITSGERE